MDETRQPSTAGEKDIFPVMHAETILKLVHELDTQQIIEGLSGSDRDIIVRGAAEIVGQYTSTVEAIRAQCGLCGI